MRSEEPLKLSRRERELMEIIYALGEASVNQALAAMEDPPGRTAVRTMLRILEEKGHLAHRQQGREFIYMPTQPRRQVGRSMLRRVVSTFFEGSVEQALAAHLSDPEQTPSEEELGRLEQLIAEARAREKE